MIFERLMCGNLVPIILPFFWVCCAITTGGENVNPKKPHQGLPPMQEQVQTLIEAVRGKRVGLLTNPTGVDDNLNQIADLLCADGATTIVAFFAPEHGLRGDHQAGGSVGDYTDPVTGIPVFSLYGSRRAPTDEQMKMLDVMVFDIQDVGVRFYTYIWTMTHCMEAAAKNNVKFIVFDRPNPIGCDRVEGAPNRQNEGLIGRYWEGQPFGVAVRYGMTSGELASLVNGEWMNPKVDLKVIKIPGYTRMTTFEETRRPWVLPSPNMPTIDTAVVYPGMCVFEGSNISEGRGTTKPFEMIGAPFIDGVALAKALNQAGLAGVRFRPAYITPTFSKYKNEMCGGVQVHVIDRNAFEPIRTGLTVLKTICAMYPDKATVTKWASRLMGIPNLENRIKTESVDALIKESAADLEAFKKIREKYLLYPDSVK